MKLTDRINISNKRLEGETYEEYKKRLKLVKKALKKYLAGFVVWQPNFNVANGQVAGPYIKKLHGEMNLKHNLDVILNSPKENEDTKGKEEE